MKGNSIDRAEEIERTLAAKSLVKTAVTVLVGQAMGAAVLVGVAALVWRLPARRLLVPYVLLLWCGPVLSSALTWARPARARPKAYAMRVALGAGAYLVMLMAALVCSAIWLGILSQTEALSRYLPLLVNVTVLVSIVLYFLLRKVFLARQSGHGGRPGDSRP